MGGFCRACTKGNVRVFNLVPGRRSVGYWNKLGNTIAGENGGDYLAASVSDGNGNVLSLSADGTILAAGSRFHDGKNGADSGEVRIYKYDNITQVWEL
jgi:hypothetical protein